MTTPQVDAIDATQNQETSMVPAQIMQEANLLVASSTESSAPGPLSSDRGATRQYNLTNEEWGSINTRIADLQITPSSTHATPIFAEELTADLVFEHTTRPFVGNKQGFAAYKWERVTYIVVVHSMPNQQGYFNIHSPVVADIAEYAKLFHPYTGDVSLDDLRYITQLEPSTVLEGQFGSKCAYAYTINWDDRCIFNMMPVSLPSGAKPFPFGEFRVSMITDFLVRADTNSTVNVEIYRRFEGFKPIGRSFAQADPLK